MSFPQTRESSRTTKTQLFLSKKNIKAAFTGMVMRTIKSVDNKPIGFLFTLILALTLTGCPKKPGSEVPDSAAFAPDEKQQEILKEAKEYPEFLEKVKAKIGICTDPFTNIDQIMNNDYDNHQITPGGPAIYYLHEKELATYFLGLKLVNKTAAFGVTLKSPNVKLECLDKLAKALAPTVGSNINSFVTGVMPASVEIASIDPSNPTNCVTDKDNMDTLNKVIAIIAFVIDYKRHVCDATSEIAKINIAIKWLKSIKDGYKTNRYSPAASISDSKLKVTKEDFTLDVSALKVDELVTLLEQLGKKVKIIQLIKTGMEGKDTTKPKHGQDPNDPYGLPNGPGGGNQLPNMPDDLGDDGYGY